MKFDFNKILEFLNPSYNQLKIMLIVSVFVIFSINPFLKSCTGQEKKTDTTELENKINKNETLTNYKFLELYNDVLDLNYRNNIHWNTKFNLFLKYGDNPELFEELIKIQDEQQRLYEEDKRTKMKYRLLPDSLVN